MAEFLLVFAVALALGWPLGLYLAAVLRGDTLPGDRLLLPVERGLYRLLGTDPARGMGWRAYATAFVLSNAVLGGFVWLLLMTQAALPLNPNGAPNMSWDLALHTAISFLTNTNQQHYSGQAQLSYLAHMAGIVTLQVVTPMMGLALVAATLRGLSGGREGASPAEGRPGAVDVGNFWVDTLRCTLRVLLPLALIVTVVLTSQGVPASMQGGPVAQPLDASTGVAEQKIPLGPVAPMVAVKQLGTNGGGWFGPNSSAPLENPTPLSNLVQTLSILLLPVATAVMAGALTRRRAFSALVVGTMLAMSLVSAGLAVRSEAFSRTAADPALMEGKEVRFGAEPSALWAALTTQTSNGSVNAMHDSLAPLTGLVAITNMLINAIWGGVGSGLQQFLVYLLLTVFLAGLMTGRTPELWGRKIEAPEVRLLAVLVLLPPLALLGMTAITLGVPGLAQNTNPGFHGISQVFYEFTSAFANNGSGFEGLGDDTPWWNLACVALLIVGRYAALILPLAVAALLAAKRAAPEGAGSLRVETPTFALALIAVVLMLTLLQFMPVLVLGPVAAHLSLAVH